MISAHEIVDYLTYCNYRHNRTISPQMAPEAWEKVYGPQAKEMERRFQMEEDDIKAERFMELHDQEFVERCEEGERHD